MEFQITNIDRETGDDITAEFTMRYRLASDPDVSGSYTVVTTTQTKMGVTYPFFDAAAMPDGIYVLHTYLTADGNTTGSKITINISGVAV
jgi:hypothetical protein